jgi:apolipoprotein N-acyltransferase
MSRIRKLSHAVSALRGWRRLLLMLAAGSMAGLAMPPLGFWPALFIAFPLLIWTLDGMAFRPLRSPFFAGWMFGIGYFAVSLHWIGFAFLVDADTYLWMMPFMVGGLAAFLAIYWGLAALAARTLWGRGLPRIVVLAAILATAEWLRGHIFTGFPWAAPGLAAEEMGGLLQLASLIGMTGLTFMLVLWAGLPALIGEKAGRMTAWAALALFALLPLSWGWGSYRVAHASSETVPGVTLRIVQPNIPQSDKWRAENELIIFEKLLTMSRRGEEQFSGATHVIWPESAVPFLLDESPEALAMIDSMLPDNAALITGSLRRERTPEGNAIFNSILGFDGFANVVTRYDKWRLVPGGEFLPLEWLLEPMGFRKVVTVPGSFTAGPGPQTLAVPGAPPAGFLICYEVIFPNRLVAAERPAWLVNVTNDGWFGNSSGPYQHLAQVRMRAVEQGIPVARAANTGISAVIDGYGQVSKSLKLGSAGIIDSSLPAVLQPTLYARTGDLALLLLVVLGLAARFLSNYRSRNLPVQTDATQLQA